MDEEKLILIVHGYPELWDMSSGIAKLPYLYDKI